MVTRAIHLELAHDLSSDSFMMCLKNFTFRRGYCKEMYSDNGTNLVGASRELAAEWKQIIPTVAEKSAEMEMQWHFNPPGAAHFGGAWERLIQSVKKYLAIILNSTFPKEDTLRCALIESEFIVNSRPLTHIPLENDEDEPITPNHFLIGCAGNSPTIATLNQDDCNARKQWEIASSLSNSFWKKWILEYLPELTRRCKWHKEVEPLKVGDIGVIIDENMLRNSWKKARVITIHPGRDGKVRTITVKTSTGEIKRPVAKFAKLDVVSSYDSNS
jgi:hypothetical protein